MSAGVTLYGSNQKAIGVAGNPLQVSVGAAALPSTGFTNQIQTTTSAVALPSNAMVNGVVLKARKTNAATIYVGFAGLTTANGYPLEPGDAVSIAVANTSAIFLIGTNTTDWLDYVGN